MLRRPIISKWLAVVFLVLCSQKIGGGLYLHDLLHAGNKETTQPGTAGKGISNACHCIDDFSTPLTPAELPLLPTPIMVVSPDVTQDPTVHFSPSFFLTAGLRGPPALAAC